MMQILTSMYTYLWFIFFYGMNIGLKKIGVRESISNTLPSLSHSVLSTLMSATTILDYSESNYYSTCSISIGYFLSDTILSVQMLQQSGRKRLLVHHIISLIGLLIPPNITSLFFIFTSECSNIPNQITYIFIKLETDARYIKVLKRIQYYSFFTGRIILYPVFIMFCPWIDISYWNMQLMYLILSTLYPMSVFWMYKLHKGYYK